MLGKIILRSVFVFVVLMVAGIAAIFIFPIKGEIPVLMYHFVVPQKQVGPTSLDVAVEHFNQQMWLLRSLHFRPISLNTYYEILKGKQKPSGKEVVITFDDGNRSYLEYALPVLRKYQIPSANFLIYDELKKGGASLTLKQAKELAKDPLVTFGSHTLSHPDLKESNPERVQYEIRESKLRLEKLLSTPVYYFCYPGGILNDFAMKTVAEAGYRLAVTTSYKRLEGRNVTNFSIPRMKICPGDDLFVFWLKVSGLVTYGEEIKVWIRSISERFSKRPASKTEPVDLYEEAA